MAFIYKVIAYIRQVLGLIFPLFRQATDFSRWGRWAWYTVHFLLIACIALGLWVLENYYSPVKDNLVPLLQTKGLHFKTFFLPSMFLLVYALAWILYWIWQQLGPDADIDEFPDITDAFRTGLDRLSTKGLRLGDLPVFLILGRNRAGSDALFEGAGVKIDISGPMRGEPPVRLWASHEAIYVTAPGASALGKQADLLQHGLNETDAGDASDALTKTLGMGEEESLDPTLQDIRGLQALAHTRQLTPEENVRLRELALAADRKPKTVKAPLTADMARVAARRLLYLCKLISRERRPFCPINGILALLPWESLEDEVPMKSTALALRTDLKATRNGLRLCAQVLGLVCDLEEVRGFAEFRGAFNREDLTKRIGQRFPMVPDHPINEQAMLYESGANWLGEHLFPGRVYQALQLDERDNRSMEQRNLFHLFRLAQQRLPRLGRMLRIGLPLPTGGSDDLDGPLLFAGCYLAATGREADHQAFTHDVFDRLEKNQGVVAWTPSALEDEVRYRRSANIGIALIVAILAGLSFAVYELAIGLGKKTSKSTASVDTRHFNQSFRSSVR